MKIDVSWDVQQLGKAFERYKDQIPFATSVAINQTAKDVKAAEVHEMKDVFNNPTPTTLNSTFVSYSNKHNLVALVKIKDFTGKGTPPSKYLQAQITGGVREAKRSEQWLRQAGILKSNQYWVPGQGLKLNKYGNVTGGKITQILSALKAFTEVGYTANRTAASSKRKKNQPKIFAVKSGSPSRLHPGVYQKKPGGGVIPLLIFVDSVNYEENYDFMFVAETTVKKRFVQNFTDAMVKAMRSAK